MEDWWKFLNEYVSNIGHPTKIHQMFRDWHSGLWDPKTENANQVNDVDPINRQVLRIKQTENTENSKAHINGKWYPEPSPENDGTYTIGYGIKLSANPYYDQLVKKQGGYMTDAQMEAAVRDLSQKHYNTAKGVYDKRFGEGSWDKLSGYMQSYLTDYSYNPGLSQFPALMDSVHEGDIERIKAESDRRMGKKKLTGRNRVMQQDADSIANGYYNIFK